MNDKKIFKNKVQLFIGNDVRLGYQFADIVTILFEFGKRIGNYISMDSLYGDPGCSWDYKRRYYYKSIYN